MDDDPDLLRLVRMQLSSDFEVETAQGPIAALELVRTRPPYQIVLADMAMPVMSGAALLETIREISPRSVRVMLTGQPQLECAIEAINRGHIFKFLTKPSPREELRKALSAALDEYERVAHEPAERAKTSAITDLDQEEELELRPGVVIAERYHVTQMLGRGGTATVWQASDQILEEDVAIKLYGNRSFVRLDPRVRRELMLCRDIVHPNVVRLYELGSLLGRPFISMQLLRGSDLRTVLQRGLVDVRDALRWLIEACTGLEHVHRQGITHRDVKPENLFLLQSGGITLMDFGLAKATRAPRNTAPGIMAGTLGYMAPEQMQCVASVDNLADIYSLGAVAYELFTGRTPFDGREPMALMSKVLFTAPAPPSTLRRELPTGIDEIVLRCLAKEPRDRFLSAGALARAYSSIS